MTKSKTHRELWTKAPSKLYFCVPYDFDTQERESCEYADRAAWYYSEGPVSEWLCQRHFDELVEDKFEALVREANKAAKHEI